MTFRVSGGEDPAVGDKRAFHTILFEEEDGVLTRFLEVSIATVFVTHERDRVLGDSVKAF